MFNYYEGCLGDRSTRVHNTDFTISNFNYLFILLFFKKLGEVLPKMMSSHRIMIHSQKVHLQGYF